VCARREHATHRVGHLFALDMKFLARSMPPVQLVYLGRSPRTWTWGGVRDEQVARELGAREGVRAARHYLRAGMPAFLARRDVRHLDRRVARMKVSRMVRFLVTFNVLGEAVLGEPFLGEVGSGAFLRNSATSPRSATTCSRRSRTASPMAAGWRATEIWWFTMRFGHPKKGDRSKGVKPRDVQPNLRSRRRPAIGIVSHISCRTL
jgi:hypothetical protein